jgi:hypothetical protein
MRKLILVFFLFVSLNSFAQTDDKARLKELRQNLIDSYKNNKFDDAQKYAEEALQLAIKVFGNEDKETAIIYTYLGIAQREREKFKDSVKSLQNAVLIFEKLKDIDILLFSQSYELLAMSEFYDGNKDKAINNYIKAINVIEINLGKDRKESFRLVLRLANLYAQKGDFKKSDETYLNGFRIVWKNKELGEKEKWEVSESRMCSNLDVNKSDREKKFKEESDKLFYELFPNQKEKQDKTDSVILNGRATFLAKPDYPKEAVKIKAEGKVLVKVLIDKDGNVSKANTVCGNVLFYNSVIKAAYKSKFSSTMLDGNPVEVSGYIYYNFGK